MGKQGCKYCGSKEYHHIKTEHFKEFIKRGWKCDNPKCGRSFVSYEYFKKEPYYKKETATEG